MNIEEAGKEYADKLCETLKNTGITTNLDEPQDAFESGCYFGAVQGFKRGVNIALSECVHQLPNIFNKIASTNFDMTINWEVEFQQMILKNVFNIEDTNKK